MVFEMDHVGKVNPMTIEVIAQILSIADKEKYGIHDPSFDDPDPFTDAKKLIEAHDKSKMQQLSQHQVNSTSAKLVPE